MDDLTLFNLISLEYFFFRYPYHNLIMTTLGKFGPNRAVMSGLVFFVFHNLIRKLAFNPQLPLMRQRKALEMTQQMTSYCGSQLLLLGRTLIFKDLLLCTIMSHRCPDRERICSLLNVGCIPDCITLF